MDKDDLKARRKRLDITQERLAFDLGLSIDAIKQYEVGRRPIKMWFVLLFRYYERYGPIEPRKPLGRPKKRNVELEIAEA